MAFYFKPGGSPFKPGGSLLDNSYNNGDRLSNDVFKKPNAGGGAGRQPSGGSNGGSGGSSGGSSGGGTSYDPYAAYQAQLQAMYEAQRRAAEEAERRKREAAQAAYNRNMSALNSAYNNQLSGLKENYDSTLGMLESDYNAGVSGVNKQADAAQQQAYINYMMSKRDMGQQMSAQGLSGGAAESTMAGLYNNYGNSRNTIDSGRNDSLADLGQQYNNSKASALQTYNGQLSDAEAAKLAYEMQLEQNLANAIADAASVNYDQQFALSQDYISRMGEIQQAAAQAAQKAASRSYSASNTAEKVSTQQNQDASNEYYRRYQEAKNLEYSDTEANQYAGEAVANYLYSLYAGGQMGLDTARQILNGFGYAG